MRFSTPIWTAFFNRRHQSGTLIARAAFVIRDNARKASLSVPITYASMSTSVVGELHPSILSLTKKLDQLAPRFELQTGEVEVLSTPQEFYDTLRAKISSAKRRIFLSSLYIGKEEQELIRAIHDALERNKALKVDILIDAIRGTREDPNPSAASLLVSLVEKFGDRVDIRMYHTPNLRGLKKRLVPKRFNEGWGLQHVKLYGVDDEIMLSGANLSGDYFTNRQDRYHIFKSTALTEYYSRYHRALQSLSYKLQPGNNPNQRFRLEWPISNNCPEPHLSPDKYRAHATSIMAPLVNPAKSNASHPSKSSVTLVYPLSQLAPFAAAGQDSLSTETIGVGYVLDILAEPTFKGGKWVFTAGYFNPSAGVKRGLLYGKSTTGTVITASAEANGFFNAPNPSGYLPDAYMILARRFLEDVQRHGMGNAIKLVEWRHNGAPGVVGDGWTYHAKGIWITAPDSKYPSLTLIGSSNFTRRSDQLDLESTCVVVTKDPALQQNLAEEIDNLKKYTSESTIESLNKLVAQHGWRRAMAVRMWLAFVGNKL